MHTIKSAGLLLVLMLSLFFVPSPTPGVASQQAGPGEFYWADGQMIPLDQRTDQLAVSVDSSVSLAALTASSGALNGFTKLRQLGPDAYLLQAPQAAVNRLAAQQSAAQKARGVRWVVPVFYSKQYRSSLVVADELIVRLLPGADAAAFFAGDPRFTSYRPLRGTSDQFVATVAAGAGLPTLALANQLQTSRQVLWATPNFYQERHKTATTDDPLLATQWHLNNTGQGGGTADADVDAFEAWDVIPGGSTNIVVAVIDDGVQTDHPDLVANIFINDGEVAGNGIDDDANGYIDDVSGWDFVNDDNNAAHDPGEAADGHGTAVAGVIAARGNNALGVSGIAYQSRLLPVRVFDGNTVGTDADFAEAINYAAGRRANGSCCWRAADILNNSWGGGAPNTVTTDAFTFAGTSGRSGLGAISFIATGNDFQSQVSYPARLAGTVPGVIAVGASTDGDLRSDYSNFGPEVDFVAPSNGGASGIVTTDRTGADGYNSGAGAAGDYATDFGGTSSATPLAAGIGALLLARDANLTPVQVRGLMRNTTDFIGPLGYTDGFNVQYGYGRLNANTAVRGVGVAEIQVLDGVSNLPDGGSINITAVIGVPITQTLRIRNQGTQDLILGAITLGSGPASVLSPPADTSLSAGESTTLVLQIAPSAATANQFMSIASNDTDETSFDLVLNVTGQTPSIIGRVYQDWNANGTLDTNDPGVAGAFVFLDTNNDGSAYTNVSATGLPQPIPDQGQLNSTINITGVSAPVTDVNVTLTISHTFDSDLDVFLISPTGTRVELFTDVGGDGHDFNGTILDDQAASSIEGGTAPFVGSYRPEGSLAALNGETANGNWTLEVNDVVNGDTGSLRAWSISISDEPFAITNGNGQYAFLNLAAGSYTLRQVVPAGWNATGPAGGSYAITLAGATISGRDFGRNQQNTIYGRVFGDADSDGVVDANEHGVSGVTVFLDTNANGAPDAGEASTTSNAFGNYLFSGLAPGNYTVRVADRPGWIRTTPVSGAHDATLAAGATVVDQNFGFSYRVALPLVVRAG